MIELELTYLAKYLPEGLKAGDSKKIVDLYIDNGSDHFDLRIRKNGDSYEVTRKSPVEDGDASKQIETTIAINQAEFESFANIRGNRIEKTRYYYEYEGRRGEFDVFEGELAGLVSVDFEFVTEEEKAAFVMPEFCLADITQETFIAGGVLSGKTYADVTADLARYNYEKII